MRKIYWFLIVIGPILTPMAHKFEAPRRGYAAIGGELLVIPLLVLIALLVEQMYELTTIVLKESRGDE